MNLPQYPFDPELGIGTISEVSASLVKANLPRAAAPEGWHHGHKVGGGEVGAFVIIECGQEALFGRVIGIRLPERERLSVEPEFGHNREVHPVGSIQLLSTISLMDGSVAGGITTYPTLGARVFGAHPLLVRWVAETGKSSVDTCNTVALDLATIPAADNMPVLLTPERLFGRHCAVLGTTGGGKSWTLGRILEQAARFRSKIVLLDATGEFHGCSTAVRHVQMGDGDPLPADSTLVSFPYSELKEEDLLALFKPAGQSQAPKFRSAMRSLKLVRAVGNNAPIVSRGLIKKAGRTKREVNRAYHENAARILAPNADFDISFLVQQISEECVYPEGRGANGEPDPNQWGRYNEGERGYCVSLLTRIEDILQSSEFNCVFQPGNRPSFNSTLDAFLRQEDERILRVSFRYLSFAYDVRAILANAVGRELLRVARSGRFQELPLLVVLDEAHQFLGRILGDENNRYPLDAFDLVAKEGRKYGLTICFATQRPRDIPEGVISQMGTLVVHRLINDNDRQVVERASGEIDKSAASFLPTLAPGQAILIGVDFPIPLTIRVIPPLHPPSSRGPDFQRHWSNPPAFSEDAAAMPSDAIPR